MIKLELSGLSEWCKWPKWSERFAKAQAFACAYRAPLLVFGLLSAAVAFDFFYRAADEDYYSRGLTQMGQGKFDAAIESFSHALRDSPKDPAARFGLGWAYHSKGWKSEALKTYDLSAKGAAEALYLSSFNMGVIYQEKHQTEEAIHAYQTALAANPNASNATYNLGFVFADRGRLEEALGMFTKTIELNPRSAAAHYNAGLTAEKLGRVGEAKRHYGAAIALDPAQSDARSRLQALGG